MDLSIRRYDDVIRFLRRGGPNLVRVVPEELLLIGRATRAFAHMAKVDAFLDIVRESLPRYTW